MVRQRSSSNLSKFCGQKVGRILRDWSILFPLYALCLLSDFEEIWFVAPSQQDTGQVKFPAKSVHVK